MAEKMVLVDGNSLMHRAFHALPLLDNGEGVYTNAVFGFLSMLFKVLKEEQPDTLAVAFDLHGPTFRHLAYPEYKAGRPATAEELKPQFSVLREILTAMHVRQVSVESYEADDILGTLSKKCAEKSIHSVLVTGDRDSFQLSGPITAILYTKRGISDTERVTPEYLSEKYGLSSLQMIDLKGLMGDASDNIPGIPGVGEKTALKLLSRYTTLENVLEQGSVQEKGKLKEKLTLFADQARFSKKLATIERNVPLEFDEDSFRIHDMKDGLPVLEKYKLTTLIQRLKTLPASMLSEAVSAPETPPSEENSYDFGETVSISDLSKLSQWVARQNPNTPLALSLSPASVSLPGKEQLLLPLGVGDLLTPGLTEKDVCAALTPLLMGNGEKVTSSVKELLDTLPPDAVLSGSVYDVSLAAYALNPQEKSYLLPDLLDRAGLAPDSKHTQAARMWILKDRQTAQLHDDGLWDLYAQVELPLAYTLHDMESAGFRVDRDQLLALGKIYKTRISETSQAVFRLAGEEFNLNSPKQLGEILFDKLLLPGGKKTGKGWSTSADVLEAIADQYEIVRLALDYRKFFKLNSTYVEALLRLRDAEGRIHTQFDQTATATGRISSNEPNLQNIPVRTEEGREIRRAFVAKPGYVLIDADYSQIELRVLAHMSEDETLRDAFLHGQDIHQRTAAEVYGVPIDQVTGQMRSAAKAVNFGIIYGISDFGLAKNIGVSRKEAASFIERYFARYPRVKGFMDSQVAIGKTQGYVATLLGRRRYLEELKSSSYNVRSFGERAAMNSPIQGTAADIIKLAMIRTHEQLKKANLRARLILQVHDELIVEAPEEECEQASAILREAMEGAMNLSVPLKVDLATGRNWHECKA